MRVEVAYALPTEQVVIELVLPDGATVGEAILASGMLARFPEIDLTRTAVGIFGERATLDDTLKEGERVEIYRPLLADPKETRRRRAR
jgi:uncharacterized protein